MTAPFSSILYPGPDAQGAPEARDAPACFRDLLLDQVVDAVTAGREAYDLKPFFHDPPADPDTIAYRQEVARDLEDPTVAQSVETFAERMRAMRGHLAMAESLDVRYERERWYLNAVLAYAEAVEGLAGQLRLLALQSRGLRDLSVYLADYVASPAFQGVTGDARGLAAELSTIRYNLHIGNLSVTVLPYDGEPDYAAVVEATFERFSRGAAKDYRVPLKRRGRLNHVEAAILERVARLHPATFEVLETFPARHAAYLDPPVARFDREVQFYLAYLAFLAPLRAAGLAFCYPRLSSTSRAVYARDTFDLALAAKLVAARATVVPNDVTLDGAERILVVTGPNHGGKTTFARVFGQVHYLARLGVPVPGAEARLFLWDRLLTHFERQEDLANLRGKLHDDLLRIREVLRQATPRSILILNEVFAATTLQDAVYLSERVMAEISRRDLLAVWVTFLDELAAFDAKTVSIVSGVDPEDPTVRTFKLTRRPADGLAYALSIAEKYRVTYRWLTERVAG